MRNAARARPLSFGVSDRGPRDNNEDELYFDDDRGVYFVVDGMGGHAAGEQAARIARQRLIGRLERPVGTVEQRVREAIALANNAVYEAAASRPDWQGMACVMTVAVVDGGEVTVGHVGDSRLYRLSGNGLEKITRDHSPVGQQEDAGELTETEAMQHPRRNEVYRDVGSQPHQPDEPGFIDIYRFPFEAASAFLLCSDGLTDALSSAEIRGIIDENAGDRTAIVRELVRRAAERGKDNVTVVFVQGPAFGIKDRRRKPRPVAVHNGKPRSEAPVVIERLVAPEEPSRWRFVMPLLWMLLGAALALAAQFLLAVAPFAPKPSVRKPEYFQVEPGPGRPISTAMAKAMAGDTIAISPGEYQDAIVLKEGVTLNGGNAIIRPPDDATAGIAANDVTATVSGLRLLAAANKRFDYGVQVHGGRVNLHGLEISGTRVAAIEFADRAGGEITGCSVHDNQGVGIALVDAAPVVSGNTLRNNAGDVPAQPHPVRRRPAR